MVSTLSCHYGGLQRDEPTIEPGETVGFRRFALRVRELVGMLEQFGEDGHIGLKCGSHVARLIKKLPRDLHATFRAPPLLVPSGDSNADAFRRVAEI